MVSLECVFSVGLEQDGPVQLPAETQEVGMAITGTVAGYVVVVFLPTGEEERQ